MNGIGSLIPRFLRSISSSDFSRLAFESARCSGLSKVLVLFGPARIQFDPLLVSLPRKLLISIRYRPPRAATRRSTSYTCPVSAVKVKFDQARYGSASGNNC
jgi:hypothetical protein